MRELLKRKIKEIQIIKYLLFYQLPNLLNLKILNINIINLQLDSFIFLQIYNYKVCFNENNIFIMLDFTLIN